MSTGGDGLAYSQSNHAKQRTDEQISRQHEDTAGFPDSAQVDNGEHKKNTEA